MNYEVRNVPLDDLRDPADKNPNVMSDVDYVSLREAIRKRGFLQPVLARLLVDDGLEIIDGRHRTKVARELGYTSVPCVVMSGVADDVARALVVGMNRLRGQLDLMVVGEMFDDMLRSGSSVEDLALTGFSATDVDEMVRSLNRTMTDALIGGDASVPSPEAEEKTTEAGYGFEVKFANVEDMRRARRALKRAAKGGTLGEGLMALIDGE